jgi:regulator of sigma E protease
VKILVFLLILGMIILVHEFGHFVLAKLAGVKVETFAIGFPPRLFALRRGETEYALNLIPLGGYVKMAGEDNPDVPRGFGAASRGWRAAILIAGITMNVLAAVLLFAAAYATGWPEVTKSEILVTEVLIGSPAQQAGIKPGDAILEMNGHPITTTDQLRTLTQSSLGKPATFIIRRDGTDETIRLTPRANVPPNQGPIGVAIVDQPLAETPVNYPVGSAIVNGAIQALQSLVQTVLVIVLLIQGLLPVADARPTGPVGIYEVVGQATQATIQTGWLYPILSVAGTISAGVAFANLLPIPGLDGGRLLFVAIEAIRGRRMRPDRENVIHFVGLAFMVSLFLVITYFDIINPISVNFTPH